jgi:hypothetical protein
VVVVVVVMVVVVIAIENILVYQRKWQEVRENCVKRIFRVLLLSGHQSRTRVNKYI